MIWFQGAPYEDENWFGGAHAEMNQAIENYRPELYGYKFAKDLYPCFHYGTSAATGCRAVIPVRALDSVQPDTSWGSEKWQRSLRC